MDVVRVSAALGNGKRYAILKALYKGSLQTCCDRFELWESGVCVADVVTAFKLSQSTVSHHLSVLENAGLVKRETRGLWTLYFPNPDGVKEYAAMLLNDLQAEATDLLACRREQS